MRLLDQVAQWSAPFLVQPPGCCSDYVALPGPAQYAKRVAQCPVRLVVADDLTRVSSELAFAGGERLASCLDLVRIPAPLLWVEWNDEMHQQAIHECGSTTQRDPAAAGRRVGVLLEGSACGRTAVARTFWTQGVAGQSASADVAMSPVESHIDLRHPHAVLTGEPQLLQGGFAGISDSADAGVAALLEHVRFRLDARGAEYYRSVAGSPEIRRQVVEDCLSAVARDVPFLVALFLLLNARDATRSSAISRAGINRKRTRQGRARLLDHLEVRASLDALGSAARAEPGASGRRGPRLHHVRGHLVRRANKVFWRTPHLRGRAARGIVRSRTVCLSFSQRRDA
jgi:hypothetical protein